MATGSILVLNTQDTATHDWSKFFPRRVIFTFTEDDSISYVDFRDANYDVIQRILNVESNVEYTISIDRPIYQIYFVPDSVLTPHKLSITNIVLDSVAILDEVNSGGIQNIFIKAGTFIYTDGTEADNICFSSLTVTNGIITGGTLPAMTENQFRFYRVLFKGRVIGYVLGNTTTSIYTSLGDYSSASINLCLSPNIGRMPLAYASADQSIYSYSVHTLAEANYFVTTAPPTPFTSFGCILERLSDAETTTFASNNKQRAGIRKQFY